MTRPWNPDDPTRVGLQFEPTSWRERSLSADQAAAVQRMAAAQSDTVNAVSGYFRLDRGGVMLTEVYAAGQEVVTDVQTTVYVPTADATQFAFTGPDGVTLTNLWQWVNDPNPRDPTSRPDPDYLRANGGAASAWYVGRLAGLASFPAGRRILAVRLITFAQGHPGFPSPWAHQLWRGTDGVNRFPGRGVYLPTTHGLLLVGELTYNPQTGIPFTGAELQALGGVSGQCGFGIQFGYGASGPSVAVLHTVGVEVVHCAENRVAWGAVPLPVTTGQWATTPLRTPAGATSFVRTLGDEHTVVWRRRPEPTDAPPPAIATTPEWGGERPALHTGIDSPTMQAGWAHYGSARLGPWGNIEQLGSPTMTVWPMVLTNTLGQGDGQPYRTPLFALLFGGTTARQEVRPTGAGTISVLRVGVRPATNGPVGDLRLRLFRAADNVQIGGAATLTRAAWDAAPPGGWIGTNRIKYVTVPMVASGAVTGATDYYVLADAPGTTGAAGIAGIDAWEIVALDGDPWLQPGYEGDARHFSWPGTTPHASADWPAQMITAPTAPASATLTLEPRFISDDGTECAVPGGSLDFPRLTWSATSLGVEFGYYEVQRREPTVSSDWVEIGRFTSETEIDPPFAPMWDDFEARRNVPAEYRVRVVRRDGGQSNWRQAAGSVTPVMTGCKFILTSARHGDIIARNDTGPREWEFLNADQMRHMRIYGRDYHVAFTSLSVFGFRQVLDLIMYGRGDLDTPAPPQENWEMFTGLDVWNIVGGVESTALLTAAGQRVWGTIRLLTGRRHDSHADLYIAEVEFVQTGDSPPVVERSDA